LQEYLTSIDLSTFLNKRYIRKENLAYQQEFSLKYFLPIVHGEHWTGSGIIFNLKKGGTRLNSR
jgi:hypothetical protein